jgi:hypothetical protein
MFIDASARAGVLLCIALLAACASDPPPPRAHGSPALPDTAPGAAGTLEALKAYRDFLAQPAPAPGDAEQPQSQRRHDAEESQDAHQH